MGQLLESARRALRPRTAYIHVTHRCDLACQHCFQAGDSHPVEEELTRDQLARVMDELAELGTLYLTITGGEPFLRRDILDILGDARQRRFAVTLKTAAHHLTPARAKALAALKLINVEVSLYSHDETVGDAFTQRPGSWKRAVRGIQALLAEGIRVTVKAAMTRFNHRHLRELAQLVNGMGATFSVDPSVNVRVNGDASSAHNLALSPAERADAWTSLGAGVKGFVGNAEAVCEGAAGFQNGSRPLCGAARTSVSISAQGAVHACVIHPTVAGNVLTHGLRQVWETSPVFQEIRSITYGEMADTGCKGCGFQKSCSPCLALAMTENGQHRACNTSSLHTAKARLIAARSVMPEPAGGWLEPAPPPALPGSGRALLKVFGQPRR